MRLNRYIANKYERWIPTILLRCGTLALLVYHVSFNGWSGYGERLPGEVWR